VIQEKGMQRWCYTSLIGDRDKRSSSHAGCMGSPHLPLRTHDVAKRVIVLLSEVEKKAERLGVQVMHSYLPWFTEHLADIL